MLTLRQALLEEEPDHWRVIALAWGVTYPDGARDIPAEIAAGMLSPSRVAEQFRSLPAQAREAVNTLREAGGKTPVAVFTHRFGAIRPMGPARREREQPWNQPASVTEHLWYRGWIGRAFLRVNNVTQEYFFLPEDLAALLPAGLSVQGSAWSVLSYTPGRDETVRRAENQAAEDACTLLSCLRNWPQPAARPLTHWRPAAPLARHVSAPDSLPMLLTILMETGLVAGDPLQPDPDRARTFLEMDSPAATEWLAAAWRDSRAWNDLAQLRALHVEGDWPNDPRETRSRFLAALRSAPRRDWCSLESTVHALQETAPEYLRPASESEAWPLRDASGAFLRGMDSWDKVEGELARFLLTGPMLWLGAVETVPAGAPRAFRITDRAGLLWEEALPPEPAREWRARVRSDGTVLIPEGAPLLLRYQLARCTRWIGRQGGIFLYRIEPQSLELARRQGVRVDHILALLEKLGGDTPPLLVRAIQRWEKHGTEMAIQSGRILVIRDPEIAKKLARRLRSGEGIATRLESPVWLVSASGVKNIRKNLAEEALLLDEPDPDDVD